MSAGRDSFALALAAVEEALRSGASYADARVQRIEREDLCLQNGELANAEATEEFGVGVRALAAGALGFAAAPLAWRAPEKAGSLAAARAAGRRACDLARALGPARRVPCSLAGRADAQGEYETPVAIDPFALPLAEKLAFLREAEAALAGPAAIVRRESTFSARRSEQWLVTSEGGRIFQRLVRTGAGLAATAASGGQVQRRSHPTSFGGNARSGGFEVARSLELAAHGPRLVEEALLLCAADPCPPGRRALIAGSSQLMLQIHESAGHPAELDRVLGDEADQAGGSFVAAGALPLRFGSKEVELVCDPELAGGLDTRAFDDEGVRSRRFRAVERGSLVALLDCRSSAARTGRTASRGTARAESWYHPPIARIPNLSLLPGGWSLEALIADTEDGVLCDTPRSWSIDDRRESFQFTTEVAWEIRGGRLGRLWRDATYQGDTLSFWRSCDAVCDASHWQVWGITDCGKGNPLQQAEMSHGAAPARFRDVRFVR